MLWEDNGLKLVLRYKSTTITVVAKLFFFRKWKNPLPRKNKGVAPYSMLQNLGLY